MLLGARTLLGAPGLTTRSKKLLGTKGIATSNKGITTSNKTLLVTSATLLVKGASLLVTRSY